MQEPQLLLGGCGVGQQRDVAELGPQQRRGLGLRVIEHEEVGAGFDERVGVAARSGLHAPPDGPAVRDFDDRRDALGAGEQCVGAGGDRPRGGPGAADLGEDKHLALRFGGLAAQGEAEGDGMALARGADALAEFAHAGVLTSGGRGLRAGGGVGSAAGGFEPSTCWLRSCSTSELHRPASAT